MSAEGIKVDPTKIKVVVNWKSKCNRGEKFLGPSRLL